jgi:hypothetical protein
LEFTDIAPEEIYPTRKSLLETVLDIYFYTETTQSMLDEITSRICFVVAKKWQSYEAAFNRGQIVISAEKLDNIEQVWFAHRRKSYDTVGHLRRKTFHLKIGSSSATFPAAEEALLGWASGESYPEFKVELFGEPSKDREISQALNHVFDGLVAFPYSNQDRLGCLTTCLRLLGTLRGPQPSWEKRIESVLGETVIVEFAPMGGRHLACAISRAALENVLDDEAYQSLRPFFRRYLRNRKLELLCFSLNHLFDFNFPDFITVFATQVIPSQFVGYLNEHLLLLSDGGALWDLAFDPLALGYFSISAYQFDYPFSLEEQIDKVLILFEEMEEPDILDEIIFVAPKVLRSNEPVGLRLHGFSQDSREIWQIPEALKILRKFADYGGLSILTVFSLVRFESEKEFVSKVPGFLPLGAFELWVILRGEMSDLLQKPETYIPAHRESFFHDLYASNSKLDDLLAAKGIRMEHIG